MTNFALKWWSDWSIFISQTCGGKQFLEIGCYELYVIEGFKMCFPLQGLKMGFSDAY